MFNLDKILSSSDRTFRGLVGMTHAQFDGLLVLFSAALESSVPVRKTPYKRKPGGGRHSELDTDAKRLFFILFYLKVYPTCDFGGFLFGVNGSQIVRWKQKYLPILEAALGEKKCLPLRGINSMEEFSQVFPDVKKVCIDATETRIARPKDKERQKRYYSGKKKAHTEKHTAVSDKRRILILTKGTYGSCHDKKDADNNHLFERIPPDVVKLADSGYQGAAKQAENVRLPHKKPKGGQLDEAQKAHNKQLGSERIGAEHNFGGTKRYRILINIYRNKSTDEHDRCVFLCAGLWNYYNETV